MTKHPNHICRFNDPPQSCDCYDQGFQEGMRTRNSGRKMYDLGRKEMKDEIIRKAGFSEIV